MAGLKAWRLSNQRYAKAAFTGEGSKILGGRWNSVGTPMVYASSSLALAVLEVFVHMDASDDPVGYVYIAADLGIEPSSAERVDLKKLPSDWKQIESPGLKRIGDAWVKSQRSLALFVPSVVVEGEWNILINPLHPAAKDMTLDQPKPFRFDARMFQGKH